MDKKKFLPFRLLRTPKKIKLLYVPTEMKNDADHPTLSFAAQVAFPHVFPRLSVFPFLSLSLFRRVYPRVFVSSCCFVRFAHVLPPPRLVNGKGQRKSFRLIVETLRSDRQRRQFAEDRGERVVSRRPRSSSRLRRTIRSRPDIVPDYLLASLLLSRSTKAIASDIAGL